MIPRSSAAICCHRAGRRRESPDGSREAAAAVAVQHGAAERVGDLVAERSGSHDPGRAGGGPWIWRRLDVGVESDVVVAESSPPEMKDSVRLALDYVRQQYRPDRAAWWLLSPADNPCLNVDVMNRVCRACAASDAEIVVPCYMPAMRTIRSPLAWPLADEVAGLGNGEGVSALLDRHRVQCLDVDDPGDPRGSRYAGRLRSAAMNEPTCRRYALGNIVVAESFLGSRKLLDLGHRPILQGTTACPQGRERDVASLA